MLFSEKMPSAMEILARPPEGDTIQDEFNRFLAIAREYGWDKLKVMFGFAWGNDIYNQDWLEEVMSPSELEHKVREAEDSGFGSICDDDLYVAVTNLEVEFTFCHENDIHISGAKDSSFIQSEKIRFLDLGWDVFERIKDTSRNIKWTPINREQAGGYQPPTRRESKIDR